MTIPLSAAKHSREYYQKHKGRIRKRQKKYYNLHREEIRKKARKTTKQRREDYLNALAALSINKIEAEHSNCSLAAKRVWKKRKAKLKKNN